MGPLRRSSRTLTMPRPARVRARVTGQRRVWASHAASRSVEGESEAPTTVAEVTASGIPAIYVPLPHGNGEQALNARDLVAGGAALLVEDGALTTDYLRTEVLPLLLDRGRLDSMSAAAVSGGSRDAAEVVARIALDAAGKAPR